MDIKWHPSPNANERRLSSLPKVIILHYTDMVSSAAALEHLCDPKAEVSAHYLITQAGIIYQLVDVTHRAWHAGVSSWQGQGDINSWSIGIELDNPGHSHGYQPFPSKQIKALLYLLPELCKQHCIQPYAILGHSDIAPERKQDPGELFPWETLNQAGFALIPHPEPLRPLPTNDHEALQILQKIGYYGNFTANLYAFQRHFVRHEVTGTLTEATQDMLSRIPYLTFFE